MLSFRSTIPRVFFELLDLCSMRLPMNPLFVALDTADAGRAEHISSVLSGCIGGIKVGLEYFVAHGPDGLRRMCDPGSSPALFLDLKLHDIPNTVAGAVRAACVLHPFMMTLHAGGGPKMIKAAVDAAHSAAEDKPPLMIAVTVLTSMDDATLAHVGVSDPLVTHVTRLAQMAQDAGADGVVCSALEAPHVRAACGKGFRLVVPGIRPVWSPKNDQERVVSPQQALHAGADYIVVGRPITRAPDMALAARQTLQEASEVLSETF